MDEENTTLEEPLNKNFREPKLRFRKYQNQSITRSTIGNLGSMYSGISGKTKDDFGHGNGKYIPFSNVLANSIIDDTWLDSIEIDDTQNKVEYGDILFTMSSENPQEAGMPSVWLSKLSPVYLNSFCFGLHTRKNNNSRYLTFLLRSYPVRKRIYPLSQGYTRFNISKKEISKVPIFLPTLEEQETIASLFVIIDNLDTRLIDKLEILKKYKEGAKQKLFNSEYGKEKHKLKEYLLEYSKKNFGLYKSVTVGKQGIRYRDEVYGKELSSNIANNKVLLEGSLVIGLGTKQIDLCVNTTDESYSVSPAYHTFKISNIDAYYLNNLLSTKNNFLSNKFMIQSARQGKTVDIKGLLDYDIYVDSKEVQNTISSCIRQIDNLIDAEEKELCNIKSIKNFLLKNMFI